MKAIYLLSSLAFLFFSYSAHAQTLEKSLQKREGKASYYHSKFNGRKTATGELFSNQGMTAASNHFPLGTIVKVTNKKTGKYVIVKINDRMSVGNPRVIDLTERAARELCFLEQGICTVIVEPTDGDEDTSIRNTSLEDSIIIRK
jgi:rare lipoprotein A